jgi:hypothetical protein
MDKSTKTKAIAKKMNSKISWGGKKADESKWATRDLAGNTITPKRIKHLLRHGFN